jgi:hypothetical protein
MSWKGVSPTASTIVDIFPYRASAPAARSLPAICPKLPRPSIEERINGIRVNEIAASALAARRLAKQCRAD